MKTILAIIAAVWTASAQAEDMQKYLSDTVTMTQEGKHEEALKRHIWFHDHSLEHDQAMYGVRLSFALGYWKELGEVYPPAKAALIETRDRKAKAILDGENNLHLFHDVIALNRTLGDQDMSVSLFEQVDQKQPEAAKTYWDVAKDAVIGAKRYDLAQKYMGNPIQEFTKVKAMYDRNVGLYDDPRMGGEHFKTYNVNMLVEESLKLIEVALSLKDEESAKDIKAKASSLVEDQRLRDAKPKE